MKNRSSYIFEKYFRWQIIDILNYFIFPEFRKENCITKLFKSNKILFTTIITIFIFFGIFFFAGKQTQKYILNDLSQTLHHKDNVIQSFIRLFDEKDKTIEVLREELASREYIEFKAFRYAKIKNFENFQRLPDEDIFLMSEECKKYDIPIEIYYRVPDQESGFRFIDNDSSGAHGYFQIMSRTYDIFAKKLKISGQHNRQNNIKVGSYMLKYTYDKWKRSGLSNRESWRYTLCEYYTGISNMKGKSGYYVPIYANEYIDNIMKYYKN